MASDSSTAGRRIVPTDAALPPLDLPPAALPPTDAAFEYDVGADLPQVEPIEHRLRVDFMEAGPIRRDQLLDTYSPWNNDPGDPDPWRAAGLEKPLGLEYAEYTCQATWQQEQPLFVDDPDESVLDQAPAFLAARLRAARDGTADLDEERANRRAWYEKLILWKNLYQVCKRGTYGGLMPQLTGPDSVRDANEFVGLVLVSDDVDPSTFGGDRGLDPWAIRQESAIYPDDTSLDIVGLPSEFGVALPAPLLAGHYRSGSWYPLVPWSDGLVCTCPYKQDKPWRVMCKHELAASICCGLEDSLSLPVDRGVAVPARARRFISPRIASSHTPSLQPNTDQ